MAPPYAAESECEFVKEEEEMEERAQLVMLMWRQLPPFTSEVEEEEVEEEEEEEEEGEKVEVMESKVHPSMYSIPSSPANTIRLSS